MAYEPVSKEEMKQVKKKTKGFKIIEPDFHQVSELAQTTLVVSSHVDERKFTPIDYIDVYAKEKTKKNDYSIDVAELLMDKGIDPNGFMIIVDITKDKKIGSMEIIRM